MLASLGCTFVHSTTTNQVLPARWASPSVKAIGRPDSNNPGWAAQPFLECQQGVQRCNRRRTQVSRGRTVHGGVSQARQQMHL